VGLDHVAVLAGNVQQLVADLGRGLVANVGNGVKSLDGLEEGGGRVFVVVADDDADREGAVVGVLGAHVEAHLGGHLVQLGRGHAVVDACTHTLRNLERVDGLQIIAKVADARRHLVERDQLELAIALQDTHGWGLVGLLLLGGGCSAGAGSKGHWYSMSRNP